MRGIRFVILSSAQKTISINQHIILFYLISDMFLFSFFFRFIKYPRVILTAQRVFFVHTILRLIKTVRLSGIML